jgi:hypothetical protein
MARGQGPIELSGLASGRYTAEAFEDSILEALDPGAW